MGACYYKHLICQEEQDNQYVLSNTTMPQLMLKKKSNYITYHFLREGTASDIWRATYINTNDNKFDLLT